ncbi:hypothetical protein Pint_18374 [Pistacia integerrima]|uniref:Uncharacterized protein n=1 Tax=Pistacia integerrima TaxID=434235 RepID=A0ACC0YXC9_9ROSI|nr:hypothetical protein Pint_18374 [Pistacia integerrima]
MTKGNSFQCLGEEKEDPRTYQKQIIGNTNCRIMEGEVGMEDLSGSKMEGSDVGFDMASIQDFMKD